jgi:nitrate reductase beta subunit
LFAAGDESVIVDVYRKLMAVRLYKRAQMTKGDESDATLALKAASMTPSQADEIYKLSTLSTINERFVIPAMAAGGSGKGKAALDSERVWKPRRR